MLIRIRQMALPLHIINFIKLRFRVQNETTLISAKNRVDLSSISEVRSYNTVAPFGPVRKTPTAYLRRKLTKLKTFPTLQAPCDVLPQRRSERMWQFT